jgi:hypothetical protein
MRQIEVVDIAAAAGDEARVLDPRYGLTDAEFLHELLPGKRLLFPRLRRGRE